VATVADQFLAELVGRVKALLVLGRPADWTCWIGHSPTGPRRIVEISSPTRKAAGRFRSASQKPLARIDAATALRTEGLQRRRDQGVRQAALRAVRRAVEKAGASRRERRWRSKPAIWTPLVKQT
jgi:hypothetical protein